jgi:DNA-binding response OmpR family regulator
VSDAQAETILVIEDEDAISSFVAAYLRKDGFNVVATASGREALGFVRANQPSLVVLDLMLPDLDGMEVCRRIREGGDLPILMLTARDDDLDKIAGLDAGADDYLTKPFNPRELVARVRAILRRSGSERPHDEGRTLEHGTLVLNAGSRECHVGDTEIRLAPKEFDLLWELLDHRGLVLTRDQLLERVWGYTFAGDTRTVDVHVRQLRKKLGDASPIVTVWGIGYKAAPPPADASTAS